MEKQCHTAAPSWRKALEFARHARRCHARCKHSKRPCKNPAVRGRRVCRMHGGRAGAPQGERNGAYRHGHCTKEAFAKRREEMRKFRALLRELDEE
jgi:hypothetical protein